MFTGIITDVGEIAKIEKIKDKRAKIFCTYNVSEIDFGASICCDGVCLTMVSLTNKIKEFYLLKETMSRSKFKNIALGDKINLELPLKYGQNISGHLCQGHVDCTSKINKIIKKGKSRIYDFNYDLLVNDPNKEIQSLISWLGWKWDDQYLSPHLNQRSIYTASNVQVRSPINSKSVGGWKNYKIMLKPAIKIITKVDRYRDLVL